MKKLLQPKVIVPTFVALGLLAGLLTFGNIEKVVGMMASFQHIYLLWFLLGMIAYEIVRGYQWHYLLRQLGISVPLKGQIFAFLIGEITKSMPIGNYFQNYILQEVGDEDFSRTSAATTLIVLSEVTVCLVGVFVIGLGTWSTAVRLVIAIGLILVVGVGLVVYASRRRLGVPEWVSRRRWMTRGIEELRKFREGARELLHPRILAVTLGLAFVYVSIAGVTLYLTMLGIGVAKPHLWDVVSVYYFSLGFSLVFPLPVDLGAAEISGVGAFLAVGVNRAAAVGTMLIFRVLSILSAVTIAAISLAVLHEEFRLVMRGRKQKPQQPENETLAKHPTGTP